jgi:hypothetical protein
MKTRRLSAVLHRSVLALTLILTTGVANVCFSQANPVITGIRRDGTNIVVQVDVPSGVRRLTLESRERFGAGTWAPAAVKQLDGTAGSVTFLLPCTRPAELLRVRADNEQPLPASFYKGTNDFTGPPTNSLGSPVRMGAEDGSPASTGLGAPDSTREVVESDIWQLSGDTLYFFNQYRGLQVIDITNPDTATVRGTLPLPAAGERMYLAGSNHVVLLARTSCSYNSDESQVMIVAVSNGQPRVVKSLPVPGWIQESRMVGTALYVASQTYRAVSGTTNTTWEWGTMVTSFDLFDIESPLTRNTLWYAGYGNVVTATDTYLFVVTQDPSNWWQSLIRIIDITDPNGTMASYASIRSAGRVADKFKLNYSGTVFTSISEDWHWNNGTTLVTKLETFRLPDPRSAAPGTITKLGDLSLGNGERLHATRFDGNLAYIVTFFRIDPLWVVDLSDPARPHISGELQVPGWSTYIQPLGDRLVAVGVESNRVAVSLFDVQDPSEPALLSRVLLGQNYSWSEANYDEKAFTVLQDIGLILVPYSGDTTNGWTSQVQLIDLNRTNLVTRGIIQHQCQPRRAAFSHNRILSLSGWQLLSVDAVDRDHPVVRGDTKLAWPVDRLFVQGNYLIELSSSSGWYGFQTQPMVRVAPADQSDRFLADLTLDNLPIVGATLKDNRLYVAQSQSFYYLPLDTGSNDVKTPNFLVTIINTHDLPQLSVLGKVSTQVDSAGWASNWEAVWPKPDELVWVGGGMNFWWYADGPIGGPVGIAASDSRSIMPFWGSGGGQLLAFNVSEPTAPKFDSAIDLTSNSWWSFSQPFVSGTLVYLSHNGSEFFPLPASSGYWVQRSLLDVIDYADPVSPTIRKPVKIPGTLQGISHSGELLYTVGIHWTTNQYDYTEWLDASAYDGVEAHLVASLPLPDAWPHPVLVKDARILIGKPGYNYTNSTLTEHKLETWTLANTGTFSLLGSVTLPNPASTLLTRGDLLAVQESDNAADLFDASNPAALIKIGRGQPSGCLWYDLNYADGTISGGLWIPLGIFGVGKIPVGN